MDAIPNLKPSDIAPYTDLLEQLQDSGLLERTDIDVSARIADIQERIRQITAQWYETKMSDLQTAPGVNKALPLLFMTDEIEKYGKLLDKRFPEPISGYVCLLFPFLYGQSLTEFAFFRIIDVVSIYVEIAVPYLATDMQNQQKKLFESSMNGPTPDVPIQDIFALYRRLKTMMSMYGAFVPRHVVSSTYFLNG